MNAGVLDPPETFSSRVLMFSGFQTCPPCAKRHPAGEQRAAATHAPNTHRKHGFITWLPHFSTPPFHWEVRTCFHFSLNPISPIVFIGPSKCADTWVWTTETFNCNTQTSTHNRSFSVFCTSSKFIPVICRNAGGSTYICSRNSSGVW